MMTSLTIADPANTAPVAHIDEPNECFQEGFESHEDAKRDTLDPINDDLHYGSVVSCLLKTSHPLVLGLHLQNCRQESSFVSWKKARLMHSRNVKGKSPQKVLKKMFLEVPQMHFRCLLESSKDVGTRVGVLRPQVDDIGASHVLSERKRRENMNRRFTVLKSVLHSINKTDKVTILDDTVEYLRELEKRIEELESFKDSDKYVRKITTCNSEKPLTKTRKKASDSREMETAEIVCNASKDNVAVVTNGDDVLIKIENRWRDRILIEIMDTIRHFRLDCHSVQSTTKEGILLLTVKSKLKGFTTASTAASIKQALQRVVGND